MEQLKLVTCDSNTIYE